MTNTRKTPGQIFHISNQPQVGPPMATVASNSVAYTLNHKAFRDHLQKLNTSKVEIQIKHNNKSASTLN